MSSNKYYAEYFAKKQGKIRLFYEEIKLPENDSIHTLKEIVKELDFSELLSQYSEKGRKATNPIMLFTLLVYANSRGIRSLRKYKNDISKHYNMQKLNAKTYVCANNRRLEFQYKRTSNSKGFEQNFAVYECLSCEGCCLKDKCFYNYNEQRYKDKNKRITINHRWEFLKAESDKNIHSQKGIENRMIRSIQSEGAFGNMKENYDFRKFNNRSIEKAYKELVFYAIGSNLNKFHK